MGLFDSVAGFLNLGANRSQNEFRDVNRGNFEAPGFQDRGNRLLGLAGQADARQGPQINMQPQGQFRSGQQALISQLQAQAAGTGPSVAEAQLRRATDRSVAQQQGLAASAAPGNQALAQRMAAQQGSAQQSGLAGQAADARIQEQLGAMAQLGGVLSGSRGQDIGLAQSQAQLAQQQTGMNDQRLLELLRQEQANAGMQQQGLMGYEQQRGQRFGQLLQTPSPGEQLLGGLSSLGGFAFGLGGGLGG